MAPTEEKRRLRSAATRRAPHNARPNDKYFTICAATKNNGDACTNRVQGKARTDFIENGRLPVCKVHLSQVLPCIPGFCEATLETGRRCSRAVPAKPGYNQLCEDHKDAILACRLLRLPTEIRLMILDILIPKGTVWHGLQHEQKYETARTLMQVCQQFRLDSEGVMYQTKQRPCEINISRESVRILEYSFTDSSSSWDTDLQVSHLDGDSLGPYQHLQINFDIGESLGSSDRALYSSLERLKRVLHAVQSTQRVTIKSIEVVIKVTYRGHLDAYMAMAFVKIVIYVLRCVDLRHVELQWSLHLEDAHALAWHPTPSPSPVLMNVAGKDIYLTSIHTLSVEDMSVLTTEIKATDKILATPSTARLYEQESSRWKVYVTIYALCTSLRSLGFASPGVVEEGFIDYDDGGWGDSPIVCPMIYAAQRALANRNDEYLAYMLDGVKSVWKEFTEPLPSVIEQIDGAGSIFDIAKTLPAARLTREQKNKWPAPLAAQIYNDDHAVVVDFVFERHVVDGKISQRLITPSIAAARLQAQYMALDSAATSW